MLAHSTPAALIGAVLTHARTHAALTQHDVALLLACSQPSVARIECGRANPALATVDAFLAVCGVEGLNLEAVVRSCIQALDERGVSVYAPEDVPSGSASIARVTLLLFTAQVVSAALSQVKPTEPQVNNESADFAVCGQSGASVVASDTLQGSFATDTPSEAP